VQKSGIGNLLLIRFLLIWLTLQFWDQFSGFLTLLIFGAIEGAQVLDIQTISDIDLAKVAGNYQQLVMVSVSLVVQVVNWVILFGFGLPLFRDVQKFLKAN
jgi:hypothetical protein